MSNRTFLVTGAMGCIGAWTLHHLVKMGEKAVSFDLQTSGHRVDLLLSDEDKQKVTFVGGDLTNTEQVANAFKEHGVTHVIHLAALQIPFCRANPVMGAQVNVTGTVNVFEAARYNNVKHIAIASSVAVYGPASMYPPGLIKNDALYGPTTLYGVYKVADEGIARVYWAEQQISSTILRPFTVYGIGRDQGVTSDPTKAMLAAMAGQPFNINFGGKQQFQFASDVALQFIEAAIKPRDGSYGYNLGGNPTAVAQIVELIKKYKPDAQITMTDAPMALPDGFDDSALRADYKVVETPIEEGVRQTMEAFGANLAAGRIKV